MDKSPAGAPAQTKKPAPDKAAGIVAPIDWEKIELDYRAGIKTLRQIADENGITHGAVNKRAKRDGWERDLSGRIQAKADALVSRKVSSASEVSEQQIVDANAKAIADIRLAHRKNFARAEEITVRLFEELDSSEDALSVRARTHQVLMTSLKMVVDLQRQAYGMDAKGAEQTPGAVGFVPPAIRVVHVRAPQQDADDE